MEIKPLHINLSDQEYDDHFVETQFESWLNDDNLEELNLSHNQIDSCYLSFFAPLLKKQNFRLLIIHGNPVCFWKKIEVTRCTDEELKHLWFSKVIWLPALVLDAPHVLKSIFDLNEPSDQHDLIIQTHRTFYSAQTKDDIDPLVKECEELLTTPYLQDMLVNARNGSAGSCQIIGGVCFAMEKYDVAVKWYKVAFKRGNVDVIERIWSCNEILSKIKQR